MPTNANIKAVITAEDRASKVISGVGTSFGKLTSSFALGALAAQGVSRALDAMRDSAIGVVKAAASFEQTRVGLENMLGSADKAKKLLGQISDFAAKTPFEFPELAQATRQLVAFGFTGQEAYKTMQQLGDVSAAVGTPINDLAYLMGTLRTQGRAFTIDIRQFAQRGIPIYEYLGRVLKVNGAELTKMIEEGKVGFPQVQKAFKLMTAQGEKFHGTMAKQSNTLNGLWSTFKDTLTLTGFKLVGLSKQGDIVKGGLFDKIKEGVKALQQFVTSDQFQAWVKRIVDWLSINLPIAINWVATQGIPLLVKAFNIAWPIVKKMAEWVGTLIRFLNEHKSALYGLIGAIAAWKTAMLIGKTVKAVQDGISLMKSAFGALQGKLAGFTGWSLFAAAAVAAFVVIKTEMDKMAERVKKKMDEIMGKSDKAVDKMGKLNKDWKAGKINDKQYQAGLKRIVSTTGAASVEAQGELNKLQNGLLGTIQSIGESIGRVVLPGGDKLFPKRHATGTAYTSGGPVMVGEQGPEMVNLPRGSKVTPHNSLGGMGGGGTTINMNVNVGMYAGSAMEKRRMASEIFRAFKDVAAQQGIPPSALMDGTNGAVIR